MPERRLLSPQELSAQLAGLPSWRIEAGRLQRDLAFGSFSRAFGFMTALALVAERMNHHPAFHNVYDKVGLTLWTHDAGGITALDIELARAADQLAANFA
jgi:4a-hydroxytetrahydrobiopterin dehydratase